ncbi:MAG: putative terminase large subunit [Prokaryotic dsDNA virus sp.]|nr:MAG: putative terminase large subunit [Prokaryotic dsDNA virus sp.]|tara:strand:- start:898 stop:2115 length:1218 start_codon:yes stop_codon:yes gene_type:complete
MQYKGFKPYDFQKQIIDDILNKDDMFYTMVCGRQIGKTLLLINMLLYYGINKPRHTLLWVSPYYSMAVKVLSQILDAIEFTPITKEANKSEKIITLINGTRIYFRSAEKPETIRGLSIDYAFLDESQDISDDAFNKAILPTLTAKGKKCLIAGTPKSKNWFHSYFQRGGDPNYNSYTAPSSVSPYVSEEFLKEQQESLPPSIYNQEFLAEWQEGDGEVFTNIDGVCILDDFVSTREKTYGGLDIGTKQDYTVLTILDRNGRCVHMWRERGLEYSQIVSKVVYLCKQYRTHLMIEANSIGDVVYEMVRKQYKDVKPFITTNTSKENIIRRLISDIADTNVELPSPNLFNPLYKELQLFQYKYLPSGKVSYEAMSGFHDDTVMSLAICNWNRIENPTSKKITITSLR